MSVTAEPRGTAAVDQRPRRAWYLAGAIVAVVFFSYCVIGLLHVLESEPTFWRLILGLLGTGSLLTIQLLYFSRPSSRLRSPFSYAMLGAQALLGYLPLLPFGQAWINMPGFLAGSVLLVLPRPHAWSVFAAIVASMAGVQAALNGAPLDICYTAIGAALSGISVFLLTGLARSVVELHTARTELAKGAVAEERLTFARNLHDLLGLSLSSIAFKGELTNRLVTKDPCLAKLELAEITEIARRALADVRSVARGYQERSLEQECRAALSVLTASDVDVRLDADPVDLPVRVRTVLAAVLHEGVTNVLRHSGVQRCDIVLRQAGKTVTIDVANDGVMPGPGPDDMDGRDTTAEIEDLSAQVTELGGTLLARKEAGGGFRLSADIPLTAERPDRRGKRHHRGSVERSTELTGGLAHTLLVTVLSGFCLAAVIHLLYLTETMWHIALSIACLGALLALQLSYFSRPTAELRSRRGYALLLVQAGLVYLPLIELGGNWVSLPGMLAGSALLVLRPAAGWTVFALVGISVAAVRGGFTTAPEDIPFNVLATVNTGLLVFGLSWLTRVANELDASRQRLAEVAVAEERLRFARDLHDLLGLSLSAIALKTELADRLLLADPRRAAAEVAEILALSRHALTDVRSVAGGYQELSLDQESRSAETALIAADVQVRVTVQTRDLPVRVGTVLAVVLREGVTNVLRHSKVEQCEIAVRHEAGTVSLEIVNDGVHDPSGDPGSSTPRSGGGSGIRNLSERVAALGGELSAEPEPDGRFRLRAVVPA